MNNALLLTDRLGDLAEMALQAHSKFEKATVYSATKALVADFETIGLPYAAHEKLAAVSASILASIEYAPADGRNNPQCVVCAKSDIEALRLILERPASYLAPGPGASDPVRH